MYTFCFAPISVHIWTKRLPKLTSRNGRWPWMCVNILYSDKYVAYYPQYLISEINDSMIQMHRIENTMFTCAVHYR